MKTILVTGGAGYLGNMISGEALRKGFNVRVVDALWFRRDIPLLNRDNPRYEFIKGNILDDRTLDNALQGVDLVVHAAAVVGDPASKKYPELTKRVNLEGSIKLIEKASARGVKGFIFLSTCSNYGVSEAVADETAALRPLSLYAETKVQVERYLMDRKADIDWVICRLSTLYGFSERMRFDLTINDFTLNAYLNRYLDIYLPYTHRPYIHVKDAANIITAIAGSFERLSNNVFNIGFNGENYQKAQIAEVVKKYIPGLNLEIVESGDDVRDYKVDFSKLKEYLDVSQENHLEDGVEEIIALLRDGRISDPRKPEYYNTDPLLEEVV